MFYVFEFQTSDEGQGAVLTNSYTDESDAEVEYHKILMYAAKSTVYKHGAMIMDEDMSIIKQEMYIHKPVEPTPEQEPEEEPKEGEE